MMVALAWALPLLGATQKTSSSSSIYLIFIVIGAAFYFLIYRPQQRKAKAAREMSSAYDVGDEVLTAGGIVGHIIDIDGDRVTLETSVGASFVVLKPYVIRKIEDLVPSGIDEDGSYDEHEEHDEQDEHEEHDEDDHDHDEDDDHDGHVEDSDESADDESDAAADQSGPRTGAGSSGGDGAPEDHPAGQGDGSGNVTKAERGDENTGSDGPSII
jgi:preprotein translocase subunit YajC